MVYSSKIKKNDDLRDGKYQLDKIVELDEGFFESVDTKKQQKKSKKKQKKGMAAKNKAPFW